MQKSSTTSKLGGSHHDTATPGGAANILGVWIVRSMVWSGIGVDVAGATWMVGMVIGLMEAVGGSGGPSGGQITGHSGQE